jgi:5''-3'' exonuclease, N-terminal resolvase-like domain./T4 RNase H, C terminal.
MILLDLNATTFSVLHATGLGADINKENIQYTILNCIRSYNMKFKDEYGDLVICTDARNYWRKDVFPYYKARRKLDREKSKIDWSQVFSWFDEVKSDLIEYFPYPVIAVDKAEADDLIAVISRSAVFDSSHKNKVLILASDSDFGQLHEWWIDQYNPVRKKKFEVSNPTKYLREHIIEGDAGDGIPNVLSDDDTFVTGKRQKVLTKQRKEHLLTADIDTFPESVKRNYARNRELIDFNCIPQNLQNEIWTTFKNTPIKNKSKLFNYFYDRKLVKFIENLQEF